MAVEFGEVGFAIIQVRVLRIVLYLTSNHNKNGTQRVYMINSELEFREAPTYRPLISVCFCSPATIWLIKSPSYKF